MFARLETDLGWGPDYGPFSYTLLPEPHLESELRRLSGLDTPCEGVDVVSFQPCPDPTVRNEDRWAAEVWDMPGGRWTFLGVFDGHAGTETAAYTARMLPAAIKARLEAVLAGTGHVEPHAVSELLVSTIEAFDESLRRSLLDIFPETTSELEQLSDTAIRERLDSDQDGARRSAVMRCMRGTTVLVALVDPTRENVWVGNVGDCRAVLGVRDIDKPRTKTFLLTTDHHASNPTELARIRSQHPDETDCVVDGRVLGALAVTRAVGDHSFKLPPAYSRRIFANVERSSRSVPPDVILARNRTPPYIISTPEVTHTRLPPRPASKSGAPNAVLILASDGLAALDDERTTAAALARCWTESAARPASAAEQEAGWADALSLRILRDALGGRDASRVSAMLTVEMMDRWMDDTTIMVCQL